MDPNQDVPPKTHFHIRWSRTARLDWESFATRAEATRRALELARPGENFTIEESEAKCSRCGELSSPIGDEQESISN
jgi:hypothetical protein